MTTRPLEDAGSLRSPLPSATQQRGAGGPGEARARYRAVSPLAVLSVVFGVLSPLVFFHWALVVLPMLGVAFGWQALRRIARAHEDMSGAGLALGGMALSVVLGAIAGGVLFYTSRYAVPMGYQLIDFERLQPDSSDPTQVLPPEIDKLEGELVFIRGYIYPGRQVRGLKGFIFVPSESHCSFCSRQLRSTEMIQVEMAGDLTADYTSRRTGIGGRLRVDHDAAAVRYGSFPYRLECDYVQ